MSNSPQKIQAQLEHQIEKRIQQGSPNRYDVDFYLRKIGRLQNDFNGVQDQLSKAKVKLRRAQDFQIKYDILLKQNTTINNDLQRKDRELYDLKSKNQYLKVQLSDKENKGEDWSSERRVLQDQINKWKNKSEEAEDRRASEVLQIKDRCDQMIKKEHDIVKRDFAERQQQYQFQIRQLKKALHEKETVQEVVNSRVDKIRRQKDEEIGRLGRVIEKQKQDHLQMVQQKNEQFDKLRQKFEKMFNFEIENLKKNLDDQDEMFQIELNGLQQMIGLKNDEINKLLNEIKKQSQDNQQQRQEMINEINLLKDKIYQVQRQNELELYNMKQRLTKIHSLDIQALEKRYNDLVGTLKVDRNELEKLIKEKDRMIDDERKQLERVKGELIDRIKEREGRIAQLQDRIKQSGDMNTSEMKNLHESFHKIQTQKEMMTNEYQTNVGFLNQQVAKLTSANELKNNQIKQLHEEIANLKRTYAEHIKDLQLKWKQERKQRQEEREKERQRKESMEEEFLSKEREWRNRQRYLEREKEKEERQKNKLKYICDEHEKDIERLNTYIKQLDDNLRKEFKRNQLNTLDNGGIRRELTAELQRQKSELEAMKRMEVDQIRKQFEIQVSRLTNQNQKLQTDLLNKSISFENLQNEFKKLEHVNKNIERINKEKLLEYQKKMATLNNEINLTQNLYQTFIDAKSRSGKKQT